MGATAPATPHGLAAHEVVLLLDSHPLDGLAAVEASRRLARLGPNRLPAPGRRGAWQRALAQLRNPLIVVLLVAAGVTAALGQVVDTAVVLAVVVVNAAVGFVQESRAEAALESLRALVTTRARVVRDGRPTEVDSERLVPGDLVLLDAGDRVPADVRVTRGAELAADESALTGESEPVTKVEVLLPRHTQVADRANILHAGTLVTAGSGAGVVVATGAQTEVGQIHRLLGAAEDLATPLTRRLTSFSRLLTVAIVALAAVTFAVGTARGRPVPEMFTAAVALAVGAIPEGLPAAVTVTLAIGVSRMARRRAVVRRLPAVETLGSTTVICSDKTGTLTENRMTVRDVWTPGTAYVVTGAADGRAGLVVGAAGRPARATEGGALHWCLVAGALCNDAALAATDDGHRVVGDPTEAAMLVVAAAAGLDREDLSRRYPRTGVVPFTSERRFMVTVHADTACPTAGGLVLVKGAVERVVAMCAEQVDSAGDVTVLDRQGAFAAAQRLADAGLRVLATAHARLPSARPVDPDALAGRLVLSGIQGMLDPPRPGVAAALQACRDAGIAVKMVTGDHATTATAVARRVGLLPAPPCPGDVVTGAELARLDDAALPDVVEAAVVLARVSPEQKLNLVRALQAHHHVLAMTGDGVNDAPALRQADIGVAMGRGGTEVAQDAADVVLLDDDFSTIEAAVEEGRGVFDNLTKFIAWTLPTNVGEGMVVLVAILLGTSLPILPTQILWINMTTAVLLGLTLAVEPREPGTMTRPPRDAREPLLTRALVARVLLVSAMLVAGAWWVFTSERAAGASLPAARTAAANVFVAVEVVYLFSCRSFARSAWAVGPLANRWLVAGVALQVAGQAAFTYAPAMHTFFDTAPIGPGSWLRVAAVSGVAGAVVAVDKHLRNRGRRGADTVRVSPRSAAPSDPL